MDSICSHIFFPIGTNKKSKCLWKSAIRKTNIFFQQEFIINHVQWCFFSDLLFMRLFEFFKLSNCTFSQRFLILTLLSKVNFIRVTIQRDKLPKIYSTSYCTKQSCRTEQTYISAVALVQVTKCIEYLKLLLGIRTFIKWANSAKSQRQLPNVFHNMIFFIWITYK